MFRPFSYADSAESSAAGFFSFIFRDLLLYQPDLAQAGKMPAALELRREPDADDFLGQIFSDDSAAEDKNVRIVVQPAHLRGKKLVAERSAHVRKLVRHNRHADAGAADEDAALHFAAGYCGRDLFTEIRIIDGLGGIGAEIDNLVSELLKNGDNFALHVEAGMIRTNCHQHMTSVIVRLISLLFGLIVPIMWN